MGILLASLAARQLGARLPAGIRPGDVVLLGMAGAIGFTVALFFATAAFPSGALDQTKMGHSSALSPLRSHSWLARVLPPTRARE